jgi:TetR/AcrR family transcriptional repressor of nem operon
MQRAGLTHGGFYAHFPSKDVLVAEAVEYAGEETISTLGGKARDAGDARSILDVADAYLSPGHLAHPEQGCPVATLGPELVRTPRRSRRTFAAGIKQRLQWLGERIPKTVRHDVRQQQATAALACMVGGVILARALDEKESLRVLDDCRAFLRQSLAAEATRDTTRRSSRGGRTKGVRRGR